MVVVEDKLLSDDIFLEHFTCNLEACKGACCWEGDFGAPLEENEIQNLQKSLPQIRPYLASRAISKIDDIGVYQIYKEDQSKGTPLLENGACVFMNYDDNGIAFCGIERAHIDDNIDFHKPISCHLYPIRIEKDKNTGFEMLNYDKWDICSAACDNGKRLKIKLYEFLKAPLIRKYGQAFYKEILNAAAYFEGRSKT